MNDETTIAEALASLDGMPLIEESEDGGNYRITIAGIWKCFQLLGEAGLLGGLSSLPCPPPHTPVIVCIKDRRYVPDIEAALALGLTAISSSCG